MEALFNKLREDYAKLPKTKRKIAGYFLKDYEEIPFKTVTSIADQLHISDTAIVKYCKELGYAGFGDFKKAMSDYVLSETSWGKRLEKRIDEMRGQDVYSQVFQVAQDNVNATFQNQHNTEVFKTIVDMIDAAENIYVVGYRSSGILARYLSRALGEQGYKTYPVTPENCDCRIISMRIKEGDLLLSFSFSRYASDVVDIIEFVRKNNVSHVSFTDTSYSPSAQRSDQYFIISNSSFHNTPSLTGAMALIDAILSETAQRHPERAAEKMKVVEEFFNYKDLYPIK